MSLKWPFLVAFALRGSWWVLPHFALSGCLGIPSVVLGMAPPGEEEQLDWTRSQGPGSSLQPPAWPLAALLFSSISCFYYVPLNGALEKTTFYIESKDPRSIPSVCPHWLLYGAQSLSLHFLSALFFFPLPLASLLGAGHRDVQVKGCFFWPGAGPSIGHSTSSWCPASFPPLLMCAEPSLLDTDAAFDVLLHLSRHLRSTNNKSKAFVYLVIYSCAFQSTLSIV